MKIHFTMAMLLSLFAPIAIADIGNLQNIELPSDTKTSWVATDMTHNGQGMAIKALSSQQTVEAVMNFYREAWQQDGDIPGYVENQIADWQVISRLSNTHNLVVQLKSNAGGATEGFISSMAFNSKSGLSSDPLPTPPNAARVSYTQTGDKGKTGHTTILVTPSSVGTAVGFYKDRLGRDGWSLVSDGNVENSHVLKFNKRTSAYEIVVSTADDGTTVILVNRTQSNG